MLLMFELLSYVKEVKLVNKKVALRRYLFPHRMLFNLTGGMRCLGWLRVRLGKLVVTLKLGNSFR